MVIASNVHQSSKWKTYRLASFQGIIPPLYGKSACYWALT